MTTTVVTGAAGGLGEAVARAFAEDGGTVVLGDRNRDEIEVLADELGGVALRTDVRDEFDVERLLEEASRAGDESGVDVVVPCAVVFHGDAGNVALQDASYSAFDDTLRTNLRGVFAAVREAVPHMDETGRVVIPTGQSARDAPAGFGSFTVSKVAVEGAMRQFAADCEQAVGCVDPGTVNTGLRGRGGRAPGDVAGLFTWAASVPERLDGSVLDVTDWEDAVD